MFEPSLADSVEQFVAATHGAADTDLDQAWAWGAYDSEGVRFAFFRTYEELRELAAQTASLRARRGPAISTAQRILAQYHRAYRDLEAALLGVEEGIADQAPDEGEWSPKEVLAHIVFADLGFYGLVRYALDRRRTGDGRPAQIPDEAWDTLLGQDEAVIQAVLEGPFGDLRAYYRSLHDRVLREFADIDEEELAVPSVYWEGPEMSLRFRLHRFDSHLRQHTVQIDKALSAIGQPPTEARRLSRLLYAALGEVEGTAIGAWDVAADLWHEVAGTIADRTTEIGDILAQAD